MVNLFCVLIPTDGQREQYREAPPPEIAAAHSDELQTRLLGWPVGIARRAVTVDFGAGDEVSEVIRLPAG